MNSISTMRRLSQFKIGFYECCKVTDRTFKNVADKLEQLMTISKLELEFGRSKVTDEAILVLSEKIIHLLKLSVFILGLGRTKVSDESLCQLLQTLQISEFQLSEVAFGFDECLGVTNHTAQQIRELLLNRKTVKEATVWTWRSSIKEDGKDAICNVTSSRSFNYLYTDII
eukprot:TRINITY_DN6704_c0_g1_i2.p1 TRINITY_DN6704_c0_g1~~TRINITY_DN6704_c0_g1_i2.p1  ORF type:complete len:171 (-),score=22.41 TRINITY_DN6704_c0_g1_i2:94-606(-)